MGFYFVFDEIL